MHHLDKQQRMSAEARSVCLEKMQKAASDFYRAACQTENHAFIEFTGLMNEYITVCRSAHQRGEDFTEFNVHAGQHMPMEPFELDYMNEKLECIFGMKMAPVVNAHETADS